MRTKILEHMLGIALFLFAIHNPYQPLITYAFLPSVGMVFTIMIVYLYLVLYYKKITLGSKFIYIPLAIISGSIAVSGLLNGQPVDAIWGVTLFGVYLVARMVGMRLFKPFMWGMILSALGVVIWALVNPGVKSGGYLVSVTNYDIIVGVLVFGTLVSAWQRQWWLSAIAVGALLLSGSEEGLFALAVLAVMIIVRRDWSKKMLLPIGVAVIGILILLPFGIPQGLYGGTIGRMSLLGEVITTNGNYVTYQGEKLEYKGQVYVELDAMTKDEALNVITGDRWINHWKLSPIKPFGYGYNMVQFYQGIPHNVVLIIIEQIGILAALAWLFLMVYCAVKTKWRYAFVAVLALGVFDHYIFTQIGIWPIALVGVASASNIGNDYIFRREYGVG